MPGSYLKLFSLNVDSDIQLFHVIRTPPQATGAGSGRQLRGSASASLTASTCGMQDSGCFSHEQLYHTCRPPARGAAANCGVYIGISYNEYIGLAGAAAGVSTYTATGGSLSVAAGQVSSDAASPGFSQHLSTMDTCLTACHAC